jgi:hypothetical protein
MVIVEGASSASASSGMTIRLNADSGSNYSYFGASLNPTASYDASNFSRTYNTTTSIALGNMANNAASDVSGYVLFSGCNSSGIKIFNSVSAANAGGGNSQVHYYIGGNYTGSSTISSVSILSSAGNFDAGKIYIYTSA